MVIYNLLPGSFVTMMTSLRMGRIVTPVKISGMKNPDDAIRCDALVDTGAAYMTLPSAWKANLGEFDSVEVIDLELANQSSLKGQICGPVKIQIEGFRAIYNEVLFVDMEPENGVYEPLVGYIILEQCQAGVDMLGHRLIHVGKMDLKKTSSSVPALKTRPAKVEPPS